MNNELAVFAETTFRNKFRKFGIKRDDRRRHMYLIGKTGMGKSTILENMIVGDIRAGHGVCVVDPHGDLAEKVIKFVPSHRINDVIYFNPADYEFPIAFNVVEQVEPHLRHLVASGLIGVFQKLWADSWGPRLEYILRNTILAILDYPGSTLLAVTRMLSDKKFRKKIVEKILDPVVRAFWVNEFAGYADKFASEAVSPIQNKVGQFLSTSLIRNIVGQVKSTIDMREIMDSGKILIVNLSKGRIGEDSSALLGNMVITKIQLSAMSRVDIDEHERKDFYLYIDEFQNFTTDSFANILSEARKYRLNLILAHQYIEQLGEVVRHAVFGNVGTLVVFRVGAADAEALEPEFTPTFLAEDILNLPKYEFYLKLMIDGIASEPFSARGLAPLRKDEETGNVEKIIAVSRERYAKDKASVEEKIARWHNSDEEEAKPAAAKAPSNDRPAPVRQDNHQSNNASYTPKAAVGEQRAAPARQQQESATPRREAPKDDRISANCSRCGNVTKLAFKPDGVRPIYCKDCLVAVREEKQNEVELRKKKKEEELARLAAQAQARVAAPAPTPVQESTQKAPVQEVRIARPDNRPRESAPKKEEAANGGLSLSQMIGMNPVDFRGKPIERKEPLRSNDEDEAESGPEISLAQLQRPKPVEKTPEQPAPSARMQPTDPDELELDRTIEF